MPAMMPPILQGTEKRVAVLGYGSGYFSVVHSGIFEYALTARDWQLKVFSPSRPGLKAALKWGARGLLGVITNRSLGRAVMQSKLPAVNTSARLEALPLPLVESDNLGVGRMAADFLLAGGFQHFAYFHLPDCWNSRLRWQGFQEHLAQCGIRTPIHCFESASANDWEQAMKHQAVRTWLRSLPKPLALFAFYDHIGVALVNLGYNMGLRIPEDLYVLGVDNTMGEMIYPPLPSVETARHEIGYRAAVMLDQLMDDRPVESRTVLIPPLRVVDRHSLQCKGVHGREVWAARRFIQHHADQEICVAQVVDAVGLARRTLEMRFKSQVGHTVLDEIRRVHLERAKELFESTDWSVERIARASGFHDHSHLEAVTRNHLGMTPTMLRHRKRPVTPAP